MGILTTLFSERKYKIAVFGGAFDPPTLGHLKVIESIRNYVDEVWIIPAYNHFHGKEMTSFLERIAMCGIAFDEMLCSGNVTLRTDEYINRKRSNGTAHALLTELTQKYSYHNIEFVFVIGQDNADNITSWDNYEKLINEYKFIIIPRLYKHDTANELYWYHRKPHIFIDDFANSSISSTEARKLIKEYNDVTKEKDWDYEHLNHIKIALSKCIDSNLLQYIIDNDVYKDL